LPWLAAALFVSGAAGLINQVVWQRALKLYLGGSEVVSAMVVVLVFMVGLGAGSLFVGLRAQRLRDPARTLALVEAALGLVTLAVAWILSFDLTASVYEVQRLAVSAGIPLRLVYAACAVVLLGVPCFLMGTTVPIAAEVCQRQLGATRSRQLDLLFAINTAGAVLGAAASGFLLLPYVGQRRALLLAAGLNGCGALLVLALRALARLRVDEAPPAARSPGVGVDLLQLLRGGVRREELVGFGLGFLALAYEMYLVRLIPLAYEPRPYAFSFVLCAFLASWSLGVWLAGRIPTCIRTLMLVAAITIAAMPFYHALDRGDVPDPADLWTTGLAYFVPPLVFGVLFAQVVNSFAARWGNDVGRYAGLNTLGSCAGIAVTTLAGFELDHVALGLLLAVGFLLLLVFHDRGERIPLPRIAGGSALAAAVALVVIGLAQPRVHGTRTTYSGREGVIEIDEYRSVFWNGLWHSRLSDGKDHLGTANWALGVLPTLAHSGRIETALVIGMGTGVTTATLAQLGSVQRVDAYEINHTLKEVLADEPVGTLHVATDPKVRILWQDARSGLALRDTVYDVITQQPLYLKEAGSSILLSKEYMELVAARLARDGVFCVYCNTLGNEAQGLLVRRTVAAVFPYYTSFGNGYCLLASHSPIDVDPQRILARAQSDDPLWSQLRESMLPFGWDRNAFEWLDCPWLVTDDHPLVEYPDAATRLLADFAVRR
jgi:spermidine synthase